MKYLPEIKLTKTKTQVTLDLGKVSGSESAYKIIKQFYFDDIEIFESMFILLLNKANKPIGYSKISQGGVCSTIVDVKIIAKYAIESLCSAIIIAHNHPSGELTPSNEDINITKKIKDTLKLFDCTILDHLILTSDKYYSFADNNCL